MVYRGVGVGGECGVENHNGEGRVGGGGERDECVATMGIWNRLTFMPGGMRGREEGVKRGREE